jgi:ABC-2 type transport system ATP-binding protein
MSNLDRSLKVREILTFHAAYHSVGRKERETRADQLLEELGLGERKNDKVNRFSGGMAQRLMIARALMHSPTFFSWMNPPIIWIRNPACSCGIAFAP